MERFDFSGMSPGEELAGAACLRTREERLTRGGKPYLVLTLANETGTGTARVWSEGIGAWDALAEGAALHVSARVKAGWRGGPPELEVHEVRALPESHPIRLELNPTSDVPLEILRERFMALGSSVSRATSYQLFEIMRESVGERFFTAPAATHHHHNTIGGLAEHSIEVAEIALSMVDRDPYRDLVDRDAIIVGACFHDSGKLFEYEWEGVPIRRGRYGHLRSHLSAGAELVRLTVGPSYLASGLVLESDVEHLCHVIESHHGEYGSMVQPATLEALVIHLADLASARLRSRSDDLLSAPAGDDHWVDPAGWKRKPIWHLASATAADLERVRSSAAARPWPDTDERPTGGTQSAAYFFPISGGGND